MTAMRKRLVALPPIVLAVALMAPGGCGVGGSSSSTDNLHAQNQKDVAQAIYDMRDAIAKRDQSKVCDSYLSTKLKNQLAGLAKQRNGTDCADELKDSLQDVDATDIKVENVTVTGNTASATVKTNLPRGNDPCASYPMVNERGWRLDAAPSDTTC
jgi:hypothetical protein